MKIHEDIPPVTYLKSGAADLLAQVNETHRPVIITQNGEARAVLQDPHSYEEMRAAIGFLKLMLSLPGESSTGSTNDWFMSSLFLIPAVISRLSFSNE